MLEEMNVDLFFTEMLIDEIILFNIQGLCNRCYAMSFTSSNSFNHQNNPMGEVF